MRRLALALSLAAVVLAAGCIEALPGAENDPAPPADDPAPASAEEDPQPPTPASPTSGNPAADPEPANATAPAPGEGPAPANGTEPAPEPPATTPWEIAGEVRLGWIAGAGTGSAGGAPAQGQTDADHCPDATFTLPADALTLRVQVSGEPATDAPSAGTYDVQVIGPDGTVLAHLEPASDLPTEDEGQSSSDWTFEAPPAGAWALRAEPVGPVVSHVWTITLTAAGESATAPAGLDAATACG